MRNRTGPPVEGSDFYGRGEELALAWDMIKNDGNSLRLPAPRRVGKTSFAKKLLTYANDDQWQTLEVNLEEVRSIEGFVELVISEVQRATWWKSVKSGVKKEAKSLLESIKPSLEFDEVKASIEWKFKKENVFNRLKGLLDHKKESLFLIDELGVLLTALIQNNDDGRKEAEFLLNWLRSFRQVSGSKIRWIFCSSIGINNITQQYQLSYTINDVSPFHLKSFKFGTAIGLINELAASKGLELPYVVKETMLEKMVWLLPFFIQILFSKIYSFHKTQGMLLDEDIVDVAYKELVKEDRLSTWDERLKQYNVLEPYIRKLLKTLCLMDIGASRDILVSVVRSPDDEEGEDDSRLAQIILILVNDGYLMRDDTTGHYIFRSPFLRDFWKNRFVL